MERYKSIMQSDGTMRREHLVIWEKAHGPIPPGYVIHHKNGNGLDNRLENLVMMTNSEHLELHNRLRREGVDPVMSSDPGVMLDRERQRKAHAKYRATHKEQIKAYYLAHREEAIARVRAYAAANKDKLAVRQKAYREAHKKEMQAYQKMYREVNHEKKLADEKAYRESHKEEIALGKKICYAVRKGKSESVIEDLRKQLQEMRSKRKGENK